ncbi:hypothetical protein DM02DRAFT_208353 [Periconia macrospinosa]|uniref:Uncharacterized protein n=1 Tax=Periconia macrospinosa TaxID=97972 RepID=A0A2V1E1G8_9PLEO|nr:hypothetical protein DM02DRAFT_208353 [Periconia macrospinosa]
MSQSPQSIHTCALPPNHAWRSLVDRSLAAWDTIISQHPETSNNLATESIQTCDSLESFLKEYIVPFSGFPMFWFFQLQSSYLAQSRLSKWSPDNLDDYVLLPALPGFVWRSNCFFVSHFWHSPQHPDPDGTYLSLYQNDLRQQTWEYIWVDWTCMPQEPREVHEKAYFTRCLRTVSGIIRNCGFMYYYPPFEARLWILYELAEYLFTCDGKLPPTPDLQTFLDHVYEMCDKGVRPTLEKYEYRSSSAKDWEILVPWLELLVLMKQLPFDVSFIRKVMDHITWFNVTGPQLYSGIMEVDRYQGILRFQGEEWRFTPFPQWRKAGLE